MYPFQFRHRHLILRGLLTAIFVVGLPAPSKSQPPAPGAKSQVFEQMPAEQVHQRSRQWVEQVAADRLAEWDQQFPADQLTSSDFLALVMFTASFANPETKTFLDAVRSSAGYQLHSLVEEQNLNLEDPWIQNNTKLWLGVELSQRQLYEEALDQLSQLDAGLLIDPAAYYFHKAVCEHHLLLREPALASLNSLLQECRQVPPRYQTVGELMLQDLKQMEDKSLNEISRKMRDVERRLDLGRSGQKVQKLEREIIESLDELITKLEQQAGGGGGGGAGGQNGQPGGGQGLSPGQRGGSMQDNVQEVAGRKDGWGSLPPREKEQAKQILSTMFPPHYQRAIEAYNRKAAQRGNDTP